MLLPKFVNKTSLDLKCLTPTSTHKSGNRLDLIYTCDCTAHYILVQPLHISDPFFIKFTLHFAISVAARISGCLADISAWMKEHHQQLNLANTELLVFPATPTLQHDFTIQLGSLTITPSTSFRDLSLIFDDQLTFKEHIGKTARSCRFSLHNIRKIWPFLTEHAAQRIVQDLVISRLDY